MNSYAIPHPRLDVIAIVTAPDALAAMRLLMERDETWGDVGIDEAVWLRRRPNANYSFSLFGDDDCDPCLVKDVKAEIRRRKNSRLVRGIERFRAFLASPRST